MFSTNLKSNNKLFNILGTLKKDTGIEKWLNIYNSTYTCITVFSIYYFFKGKRID